MKNLTRSSSDLILSELNSLCLASKVRAYRMLQDHPELTPIAPGYFMRELARFEDRKGLGDNSTIPLHGLMKAISPFYERIFQLGEEFEISLIPVFKTPGRFYLEFNPFLDFAEVSAVGEEIKWLSRQRPSRASIFEIGNLSNFNFGGFHSVFHSIFSKTALPPSRREELEDYYLLMEALAFLLERYIAKDVGLLISGVLRMAGLLLHPYKNEPPIGTSIVGTERIFTTIFANILTDLHRWPVQKQKKILPSSAPYVPCDSARVSRGFTDSIVQRWMPQALQYSYPTNKVTRASLQQRLKLKSLKAEDLIQEKTLKQIWSWADTLFQISYLDQKTL